MSDFKVKYKGDENPKIKSKKYEGVMLKFRKGPDDLKNHKEFEAFIKGVEQLVRTDIRYKKYKEKLCEAGLNRCAFYSDITNDMATIEMHHGPMFTLFDICAIVTDTLLKKGEKVTTFSVANSVLEEHETHHIQITMLTKTAHQMYHSGNLFIHYKQAWGNIEKFIKNYKKGIKEEHIYTMLDYIKLCKKNKSIDNEMLQVVSKIEKNIK